MAADTIAGSRCGSNGHSTICARLSSIHSDG